ncbi:hypothetical protein ACFQE1_18140, partial [Halobium palmae]
ALVAAGIRTPRATAIDRPPCFGPPLSSVTAPALRASAALRSPLSTKALLPAIAPRSALPGSGG